MKWIALITFICLGFLCKAQTVNLKEKLYYFKTKDSLVGVRNTAGKIVIKPRAVYADYSNAYMRTPIEDDIIFLEQAPDEVNEPHSWGSVYDRKGKFLFAAMAFDNGAEGFFAEGLIRFIKNGKVGFANRHGDIVIEAKYDFAGIFNYGTVDYCNGCTWGYKNEHISITGGTWGYIDNKGNTVNVNDKRVSEKDQAIESGKFLPYQFSYSLFEQKIIDSLYKLSIISKAYFASYSSPLDSSERILRYEIVERPSSFFPYYLVATFAYDKRGEYRGDPFGGPNFCVNTKGDQYFNFTAGERTPLKIWLKQYVKDAKLYLNKHPDAPYKF